MQLSTSPSGKSYPPLRSGQVVLNHITGRRYRVGKQLGAGGFGAVYGVCQLAGPNRLPGECCLKIAADPTAWHREAYFGELFRNVPGVVRIHESFAWMPPQGAQPLYCLISELAGGGDLLHYLEAHRQPWNEVRARREIIRLLRTVMLLHEAGAVHRDITPSNVFLTSRQSLKLGDFGIASHRVGKHDILADVFAGWLAPPGMLGKQKQIWRAADDVYHLGQLFAMLLCGYAESKLTTGDVKKLVCTPETKVVLQRCIGQRRKRFVDAAKMLSALQEQEPQAKKRIMVRSLEGKRVVFTGPMSIRRADAEQLVTKAGGIVEHEVTHHTNVLVVGGRSPFWKADSKGQKLLDMDSESELGNKIAVVTEHRFRVLASKVAK